jgi:hypothetical protein
MKGILGAMSRPGQTPEARQLALHACCGPCLIEPYEAFVGDGDKVTVVYYNPNIHPFEEYGRRLSVVLDYASRHGVEVVELPYEPDAWQQAVSGAMTRQERCRRCYQLRLGVVSRWAAENGYDSFSTTLTVSPYQEFEAIGVEGESAAMDAHVAYVHRDFRDCYSDATRRSRDEGMYRQNYCGCAPSEAEARADRAARKAARQAEPKRSPDLP